MDKKISYTILSFYVLLLVFVVISLENPKWLQELSEPGRNTEARTYMDEANIQIYSGNYLEARDIYLKALEIDTANRIIYGNLGLAYIKLGDFPKAEACLNQVKRMSTGMDSIAMFNYYESMGNLRKEIGYQLKAQGKNADNYFEEALHYYERAMKIMTHEPNLDYKYAHLLKSMGRDSLAVEYFNSGIQKDISPETEYYSALMNDYIPEIAKGHTESSLKIQSLIKSGNIDWSKYDIEAIKSQKLKSPQLALAYYNLGEIYLRNKRPDLADIALVQCVAINPLAKQEVERLKQSYGE